MQKLTIPAKIGTKDVKIVTDVVETSVPLLLSKEAMKKAETNIDFVKDEVSMFGSKQDVHVTQAGHYAIQLNQSRMILNSLNKNQDLKINLVVSKFNLEHKQKVASKLHSQFGHPTKNKLLKLLDRAGLEDNKALKEEICKLEKSCEICKEFKKPMPTPAVGLPHASSFNETVAFYCKFYDKFIILHLIDHLNRFSTAIVIRSKQPKDVIDGIVKAWISLFGTPKKFLFDNGGEFSSAAFIELAESMNIRILSTPGYSPWSNGLVEWHNATLEEMLDKILAEGRTNIHTALRGQYKQKMAKPMFMDFRRRN